MSQHRGGNSDHARLRIKAQSRTHKRKKHENIGLVRIGRDVEFSNNPKAKQLQALPGIQLPQQGRKGYAGTKQACGDKQAKQLYAPFQGGLIP